MVPLMVKIVVGGSCYCVRGEEQAAGEGSWAAWRRLGPEVVCMKPWRFDAAEYYVSRPGRERLGRDVGKRDSLDYLMDEFRLASRKVNWCSMYMREEGERSLDVTKLTSMWRQ